MSPIINIDFPWAVKTRACKKIVVRPGELKWHSVISCDPETNQLLV